MLLNLTGNRKTINPMAGRGWGAGWAPEQMWYVWFISSSSPSGIWLSNLLPAHSQGNHRFRSKVHQKRQKPHICSPSPPPQGLRLKAFATYATQLPGVQAPLPPPLQAAMNHNNFITMTTNRIQKNGSGSKSSNHNPRTCFYQNS